MNASNINSPFKFTALICSRPLLKDGNHVSTKSMHQKIEISFKKGLINIDICIVRNEEKRNIRDIQKPVIEIRVIIHSG